MKIQKENAPENKIFRSFDVIERKSIEIKLYFFFSSLESSLALKGLKPFEELEFLS